MKKLFLFLNLIFAVMTTIQASRPDNAKLDRKVDKIHRSIISIDSHTDTPLRFTLQGFDISKRHDPDKDHSKVDFPRMKEGGLDAAFFAIFLSQGKRTQEGYHKVIDKTFSLFDTIHKITGSFPELCGLALTPADAIRLKKEGKRIIFIGIENGYAIGDRLDLIQTYFNKGARYITLCHTKNNDICDSSTDTIQNNGLSLFGKKVVAEMNRTGMMVDVSHISDKSFYDVITLTKAPVIASHSCSRAICDNHRNLDDNMLKMLSRNGGVIQMCILSDYVKKPDPNPARDSAEKALYKKYHNFSDLTEEEMKQAHIDWDTFEHGFPQKLATVADVVDHIDHIVKVAGIDHVGIGTDFDGGGGVTGCYDVSQMKNITKELVKRGYTTGQIRKIWGGNLMRVMDKVRVISIKLNTVNN
ncbi:MAG: dipeptidase [Bacteroidetes bacterium]|nr:dipeptidase [Bacteroidota bacterium]